MLIWVSKVCKQLRRDRERNISIESTPEIAGQQREINRELILDLLGLMVVVVVAVIL